MNSLDYISVPYSRVMWSPALSCNVKSGVVEYCSVSRSIVVSCDLLQSKVK